MNRGKYQIPIRAMTLKHFNDATRTQLFRSQPFTFQQQSVGLHL